MIFLPWSMDSPISPSNRFSQLLSMRTSFQHVSPNSFLPSIVIVHSITIALSPIKTMVMDCSSLTTRVRPQRNYRSRCLFRRRLRAAHDPGGSGVTGSSGRQRAGQPTGSPDPTCRFLRVIFRQIKHTTKSNAFPDLAAVRLWLDDFVYGPVCWRTISVSSSAYLSRDPETVTPLK